MTQALFAGLVFDENDQPVEVTTIGGEAMYIVNDGGFRRHIPSETVDRQVLERIRAEIQGNEGLISEQAAKMLGQEDIFTRAILQNQISNIDQQFEQLLQTGLPEEGRTYMGMMGFKIVINFHGEVVQLNQPTAIDPGDEE
ncbi:MAG TPA: hypothetical protein PKD23_00245 [Bellilinea sp.]|jgi:hypothetical protein|nr:hypothetical protein [Bellilinea sp.]